MTRTTALLVCAVCLALTSCTIKEKFAPTKEKEPVPVSIMEIEPQVESSSLTYIGKVTASRNAIVLSQYPGTVESISVRKGARVQKGTQMATISSELVRSAYDIAKATLDQAEDAYARVTKVYESGSITELRNIEVRTQLEKARAAEKSAREALDDCTLKAPFTGIVGEIYPSAGEKVIAAAPIVQLIDVGELEIHFSVPENEYSSIAAGDDVTVEIQAIEATVKGSVAVKGVEASALSHCYDCTVKGLSSTAGMMPGMVCKVRINRESDAAFVVPASAVMTDMGGRYVWAVDAESSVTKQYITPGGYSGCGIIVTDGLEQGDKVIIEGSRKVSTGMKVCSR